MKDVTNNADKATRFLPVDMKDRLKTIFNRTPSRAPAQDDDVPDYSAIFNANKAPGQKKARFNGPLEPPQLAEPSARAAMKESGMQRAQEIEDAEIVIESSPVPPVRTVEEETPAAAMETSAAQESFAQRAAAKAKALAANAQEALKSRVASIKPEAPAPVEEETVPQESFAYRAQPKPTPPAASAEESFAYRAAPKKPEAPASAEAESFAYRAAPKKTETPASADAGEFAYRTSAPKAKAPVSTEESFAYRAAPKKTETPASSESDPFAYRATPRKPEPKPEPRAEEHKPEPRAEARPVEERKPESQFTSEMWKSHESERKAEERKPERREEPRAQAVESPRDDSDLESRFGRLSSSEHVRLKVDPRPADERRTQERQPEEPAPAMASSDYQRTPEPIRPYRETAEPKPRTTTQEHTAASFTHEAKPLEQPRETRHSGEPAASRTPASERSNLHQQKETSMYAKGQQQESHENGTATVRTEGANLASIAIERNSKFSGQLKFSGAIAIDGQVEGELVAERVVVHEGGTVNATIEGNSVVVAGTVKGDIYARAELEVLPSGVIHGSVTTPSINVRRGGRIDGRCTIGAPRQ